MTPIARVGRRAGTIRGKMVLVVLLLTLLTMQFIGAYLLRSLQGYYLTDFQQQLRVRAESLARAVAGDLASGAHGDTIQAIVSAFGEEREFAVLVIGRDGTVRGSLGGELGLGEHDWDPGVRQVLGGGKSVLTPTQVDPVTRLPFMAYVLPVTAGSRRVGAVYVKGYLKQIYDTLAGVRRVLFEATLVALVANGLLSLALARTLTGPIQELTARASELAAGRFDRLIEVRSGDELGRLGAMFNAMTVRLRETLGEISAEKRKAEAILTNMADGLVTVDAGGRVTAANPAAERMLHVRAGDAVPASLAPLLPPGGDRTPARIELPERDRVLLAHVTHLTEGAVVVLQDVSEQERLESLRREFVADVSHELRTPITTIKSYVESLLDGALAEPEVARRFLQVAADETNRMVRLINDLLQLSHLDRRAAGGERRPTDLAALVAELRDRLGERCRHKGITLECHYPRNLPWAYADADRITQVLTNLLTNAIDFTPAGGRVDILLGYEDGQLTVRVRDTGVGIPPADLPRVFDRFYRVDKARSREFGGTGLGLSIAKQIVDAHDGTIAIASVPGRGTEVRFTLPCAPEGAA